jgi:ubiquinone/menaquinone biosynthesis C-methylase UbiE
MLERELETEVMDTAEEAADYDAMDHSEPNAAFVARLVELRAHGRMLDLGTGPAHIPMLVVERIADCTVLGVDLSTEMLNLAEAKRAASRHADRIDFQLADVKSLPFEDTSFDTVFSNTILHHIPEPGAMLREATRVLRPDGVLLIRDLYRPPDERRLDDLVALHAGDATPHQRQMFRNSLKAALTPDELRAMVAELGVHGAVVVVDTDRHMSWQRGI